MCIIYGANPQPLRGLSPTLWISHQIKSKILKDRASGAIRWRRFLE
jgi:hypothetical protein